MAILNSLLRGQLKGRIGNQWFAHAKNSQGRPVTRTGTINSSPNNPQTYDQMLRRAKFANAVKFYQHAQAAFFPFAFEQKKANETDYNAFMRLNIDRSPLLSKELVSDPNFPAVSNSWILTSGSLSRGSGSFKNFFSIDSSSQSGYYGLKCEVGENPTIGSFSVDLIKELGCVAGDIFTIVVISLPYWIDSDGNLLDISQGPQWYTFQCIVDPTNSAPLSSIPHRPSTSSNLVVTEENRGSYETFFFPNKGEFDVISYVTVTRKGKNKLIPMVSIFIPSSTFTKELDWYTSHYSEDEILESWYAKTQETLQGGVADPTGSGSDSSSAKVTRITVNSSENQNLSELKTGANEAFRVYGSNITNLSPSDFEVVGGSATLYQYIEGSYGTLIVKIGSDAGSFSISYGGTTYLQGTVVAS